MFLKRWSRTHSLTETSIGKFYIAIDTHLLERGSTTYNTYRFIEQLVSSSTPDTFLMDLWVGQKYLLFES